MSTSENFVIAGVHSSGSVKGTAIQMSPSEKIPVAVGLAASEVDTNFSVWVKDIALGATSFTKKGSPLGAKYEHNDYVAEGTGLFTYLRKKDSVMLEPKKRAFRIKFCDCLNRYGAPDLKIDSFEIDPVS